MRKEPKKPKRHVIDWPDYKNSPVHVRNWFRTLRSKKLKGRARDEKIKHALDTFQ